MSGRLSQRGQSFCVSVPEDTVAEDGDLLPDDDPSIGALFEEAGREEMEIEKRGRHRKGWFKNAQASFAAYESMERKSVDASGSGACSSSQTPPQLTIQASPDVAKAATPSGKEPLKPMTSTSDASTKEGEMTERSTNQSGHSGCSLKGRGSTSKELPPVQNESAEEPCRIPSQKTPRGAT
jgi:hypothetical protein